MMTIDDVRQYGSHMLVHVKRKDIKKYLDSLSIEELYRLDNELEDIYDTCEKDSDGKLEWIMSETESRIHKYHLQ